MVFAVRAAAPPWIAMDSILKRVDPLNDRWIEVLRDRIEKSLHAVDGIAATGVGRGLECDKLRSQRDAPRAVEIREASCDLLLPSCNPLRCEEEALCVSRQLVCPVSR